MTGLEVANLSVQVDSTEILHEVGFEVPEGEVTFLVGPNGAGKSTLLHAIAGVSSGRVGGSIRYQSQDLSRMRRRERAKTLALVEQDAHTDLSLSVLEAVMLGRLPHLGAFGVESETDRQVARQALQTAGLNEAEFGGRIVTGLSGGERQKMLLARALTQEPSLLLLDEPTNHLDIAAQLSVLKLLRSLSSKSVTVLAAIHDLSLAANFSDNVVVLSGGEVAASGPTKRTLTPELIETVFRVRAHYLKDSVTKSQVLVLTPLEEPEND